MNRVDARRIAAVLDEVITNRRGKTLFPMGADGPPSNLGAIWMTELMKLERADLAGQAVAAMFSMSPERLPVPADLKSAYKKLERDEKMAVPALPEAVDDMPDFKREVPAWVKGKLLALASGDTRAWPEQKPAYDELQRDNPWDRTYVWDEQTPIDPDSRARYEELGSKLTGDRFDALVQQVTSAAR